jgi:hypothetical protein
MLAFDDYVIGDEIVSQEIEGVNDDTFCLLAILIIVSRRRSRCY